MFHHISWASYGYSLTILLILYYAVVISRYYAADLLQLIRNKSGRDAVKPTSVPPPIAVPMAEEQHRGANAEPALETDTVDPLKPMAIC